MLRLLMAFAAMSFLSSGAFAAPDYVGSDTCTDCHEAEARAWERSDHALAWTMPGPDTVLADFDGTAFEGRDLKVRFRHEAGRYFATVTEMDGSTTDYPIHSVAGVAPLQQYLIETRPGRLQGFDIAWDVARQRWYDLYPDQDLPPGDGLHWTGPYKTWNARCAECHATNYRRNYNPARKTYASTQAEIGVGCESCHGPGSAHLAWTRGEAPGEGLDAHGFTMSFGTGDTTREIEQCAGCHSRREALLDGNPLPGTPFADAYNLALLRPGLYHPDGQILDEVYVWGSFLQSKMRARGVGCMNCHEPHGATLKLEGNALCAQCHSPAGNPDFPTLRKANYDDPAHHHHAAGSAGAQCVSCHMIERTYMGVDGRRDHSFRVPRPDLGAKIGTPDACTDCHADRGQDWAAARIRDWFPDSTRRGPHFGEVFAKAAQDPSAVVPGLLDIALDEGRPAIVRATAMSFLQVVPNPETAAKVAPLLDHSDPLIRAASVELQRGLPAAERIGPLMPRLQDTARSVRIAAARNMLGVNPADLRPSQRALLQEAMREWQASLGNKLDFPETHMVLGGIALTQRNAKAAESAFREAVQLDPQQARAWSMLVRLVQLNRGPEAARQTVDEALSHLPRDTTLLRMKSELGG